MMKKKKRRFDETVHDSGAKEVGNGHVLTLCDDLERFLAPSNPEISRVRVPAAQRTGIVSTTDTTDCALLSPKPCEAEESFGALELGLKLSEDALKDAGQGFVEEFEKLLEMKFGIMALRIRHGLDAWCLGSQMINPFEIVSFVAATSVMNRAYFKMWELIETFDLVPSVSQTSRFLSAHLCEGPGGFIEAVLDYRGRSSISEAKGEDCTIDLLSRESPRAGSRSADMNEADRKSSSDSSSACMRSNGSGPVNQTYLGDDSKIDSSMQLSGIGVCRGSPEAGCMIHSSALVDGDNLREESVDDNKARSTEIEQNRLDISRANSACEDRSSSYSIAPLQSVCDLTKRRVDGAHAILALNNSRAVVMSNSPCSRKWQCSSLPIEINNVAENAKNWQPESQIRTKTYHDLWFGLTLASTTGCEVAGSAPRMETTRLNDKVAGKSEGHVHYGVDGSGDLTNPANVSAFVEDTLGCTAGQRMDLITADGAFDVSEEFSSQEHSHLQLVFCEVVSALLLQAEGGSFVLKLFDCYTASTLSIVSLLSSLYSKVEIVRLRTTRVCNSERYVVAKGYLGLSSQLEQVLLRLNSEWSQAAMRGEKVGLLLSGGFPDQLLQAVMESNAAISAVQIDGINRALQLADAIGERLPPPDAFGRRKGCVSMLRRKLNTQARMQRNAIALCNELHIPCKSQFFGKECLLPSIVSKSVCIEKEVCEL